VAAKMLSHIGHQVAVAEEGGMAVEMYRNAGNSGRPFDVVILDLTIKGGMGGREALEKMIEINPGVKAIVSSGYSNDPVLSDFKKFGFRGMVAKPYRMEDLKQILSRVIRE
ncbi:MAG: response regulator receiver protein, partial [Candidatus Glassbacteria bacterium GWA2_58_10]